eukprot:5328571-Pyramimonas_sp.AAC.2
MVNLPQNIVDFASTTLCFFFFGYALAFGTNDHDHNQFVGTNLFFLHKFDGREKGADLPHVFFILTFATAAGTIMSGAMAERTKLLPYVVRDWFSRWVYTASPPAIGSLNVVAAVTVVVAVAQIANNLSYDEVLIIALCYALALCRTSPSRGAPSLSYLRRLRRRCRLSGGCKRRCCPR